MGLFILATLVLLMVLLSKLTPSLDIILQNAVETLFTINNEVTFVNDKEEGLARLVRARPSVREVPSSIRSETSNPSFDFFPFRVTLSSFKYP